MDNVVINITEITDSVQVNVNEAITQVFTDGVTVTGNGTISNPLVAVAGSGDMLRATYDPTNKNADAFSMENMIEGATKKILTSAERTKLNNLSGTNTGDQDLTPYLTSATAAATYQPIGAYLTTISGLNISQLTNDSGYITSAALSGLVPTSRTITINGTTYDLSADRSWTISAGTTYTFSTGLTNNAGTVTANLSTGVAGGQSVVGGTAASNNLTLSSTSNATKGKILFGTSAYDEVNNRLGIGTSSPNAQVHLRGVSGVANGLIVESPDFTPFVKIQTGTTSVNRRPLIAFASPSTEWAVGFITSDNKFRIAQSGDLGNDTTCALAIDKSTNNVGVGTVNPSPSAKLDVWSTTSGFAPPEMTATQASAISTTSRKLIIYVTSTNGTFTSAGLWLWTGATWKLILAQ